MTPSKAGYSFNPGSQSVTINGANLTGVNFAAQPVTVSGTITPSSLSSGALVTLNAGPISTMVDAGGGFTLIGVPNGT